MLISVYTDGSCDDRTYGSYGYIITARVGGGKVKARRFSSVKYVDTTNNRMELKAIIKALESIDVGHSIDVYSDSEYCVQSINEWLAGWLKKGVLDRKKNPDLWRRFMEVREKHLRGNSKLKFSWVRGHSGNGYNEIADKLASVGRLSQQGAISCKKGN